MNDGQLLIAARALLYGGALTALGLPLHLATTTRDARAWLGTERGGGRIVAGAALLALAATAVHILLLAAAMGGVAMADVDRELLSITLFDMTVGHAAIVRFAALLPLAIAPPLWRGRVPAWSGLPAAVAVATLPWNGHAVMHEGVAGWSHLAADLVHLSAAALWLGAILAFVLMMRRGEAQPLRAAALDRFGAVGIGAVVLLAVTGAINALLITAPLSAALFQTRYMGLLAVKLALFAGMLALAARHRHRLVPGLSATGGAARLTRSLIVELALFAAIVVVVAALGTNSPR